MGGTEHTAHRKASAPTPELDSNPWIDDVTFALNECVTTDQAPAKDFRRTSSRSRKETPRLDLSRLFTRRKSSKVSDKSSPLDPPATAVYAAPPTSAPRDWQQTTNPWGIRIRKTKSSIGTDILSPHFNGLDLDDSGFQSPKIHIRKPPPGIQYWFDGVDDDAASVKSEPEGLPWVCPDSFCPTSNRDTFLSISTNHSRHSGRAPMPLRSQSQPVDRDLGLEKLDYFSMSATPTRPRTATVTVSPTDPFGRPTSRRSRSSVSTIRDMSKPTLQTSCGRKHLPASIDRGQSVLVLSETDDSEDDDVEMDPSLTLFDDIALSSFHDVADASTLEERERIRQHHTHLAAKRLNCVPDLVSTTSIEEGSQMTVDDHSPRTSLLSDLRPVSFRSEYRPLSFKTADRPISLQTFESDDQNAFLTSPTDTLSDVTSPPDLSLYLSESCPPLSRPQSTQRRYSSAKPQRIMVVTDEEARLLSCMRKRRAEMEQHKASKSSDRSAQRQLNHSPQHARSRSSTAHQENHQDSVSQRPHTPQSADADQLRWSASVKTDMASEAAALSPFSSQLTGERRPSTDTVTRVWEDVQQWRRRPSTPPSHNASHKRHPSSPRVGSAPPGMSTFLTSHFSPDSSSMSQTSRATLSQRMANETGVGSTAVKGWQNSSPVMPRKDCGQTLGEALRKRDLTDVQADVLAAWNDLGGWRRSMMSGNGNQNASHT